MTPEQKIEQASESKDWKEQKDIENFVNSCCKEIPYEGIEVDKYRLREGIQEWKTKGFIEGAKSQAAKEYWFEKLPKALFIRVQEALSDLTTLADGYENDYVEFNEFLKILDNA